MSKLTFGSAFAGIGGFDLGLERAGLKCSWQIENNPFCIKVLQLRWPDVTRFGNIVDVDPKELDPVDVMCGGFPCQDISSLGNKEGIIYGKHSSLWFEYHRLIRDIRPRYVIVENVTAILHRGMEHVLGPLAEIGYDCWWDCIPAAAIGAPHHRDRLFLVAHSNSIGRVEQSVKSDSVRGGWQARLEAQVSHPGFWRFGSIAKVALAQAAQRPWPPEPDVGRLADGVPDQVAKLGALGNAVVPRIAEFLGNSIIEFDKEAYHCRY